MHEIITIQLGNFANYVGTHFWNTQESYFTYGDNEKPSVINHDINFRAGLGIGNVETFNPRVLIYDLKGGFGSLRKINQLYQDEPAEDITAGINALWSGKQEKHKLPIVSKNVFQESLDQGTIPEPLEAENVRYWSDFNSIFYHPRSTIQINEYEHENPLTPFDTFDVGTEIFEALDKQEDILDQHFRPFAEECDLMQGLQLLTSVDDAWGGFATKYINNLRDEYPKSTIWAWSFERSVKTTRERMLKRTTSSLQSLIGLLPSCTTYVPMSIPRKSPRLPSYLGNFDENSDWQTSALIGAAFESFTLPTRLKVNNSRISNMNDISMFLNSKGNQQVSNLNLNYISEGFQDSTANYFPNPIDFSWPGQNEHIFSSYEVIRGGSLRSEPNDITRATPFERYSSDLSFPILSSFPKIFESPEREGSTLENLPIATSLKTSSSVLEHFKSAQILANRLVGLEERETIVNNLGELREAYQEGWNSDSDDFDD